MASLKQAVTSYALKVLGDVIAPLFMLISYKPSCYKKI